MVNRHNTIPISTFSITSRPCNRIDLCFIRLLIWIIQNIQKNVAKSREVLKLAIPRIAEIEQFAAQDALKNALITDPDVISEQRKKELDVFLRLKRKAELEAFSKYGLTNITDKYLPQKLELAKSL